MPAKPPYKTGRFIKAEDGKIYRLVGVGLEGVDETVVEKVTARLNQPDAEPGASVRIAEEGEEGVFIAHDLAHSFDKDKDTP